MATDKWLTAIGAFTQTIFWAIGYFFGFTLVTVLSLGLLYSGSFDEIGRPRDRSSRVVTRRQGKYFVAAEFVAAIGWMFLAALNWVFFWNLAVLF